MPTRLHVIGKKNSGKTTLVTDLVEYWSRQGLTVGTIKHTHHGHELDTPGKDSFRHRQAGAAAVGILARNMSAVFLPAEPNTETEDRYALLEPAFRHCDLILVEGDVRATAARVEVWRAAAGQTPYARDDTGIRALITDDPISVPMPVHRRSDLPRLAAALRELIGA